MSEIKIIPEERRFLTCPFYSHLEGTDCVFKACNGCKRISRNDGKTPIHHHKSCKIRDELTYFCNVEWFQKLLGLPRCLKIMPESSKEVEPLVGLPPISSSSVPPADKDGLPDHLEPVTAPSEPELKLEPEHSEEKCCLPAHLKPKEHFYGCVACGFSFPKPKADFTPDLGVLRVCYAKGHDKVRPFLEFDNILFFMKKVEEFRTLFYLEHPLGIPKSTE